MIISILVGYGNGVYDVFSNLLTIWIKKGENVDPWI